MRSGIIMKLDFVIGLIIQVFLVSVGSESRCRFPQEWRGRYYQSGLGEIVIKSNLITTKGRCVEQSRDYYLFDNSDGNCFHCLLLLRQHKNIIQYKESYCTRPATLKMVCAQIRVETPLYTLVREPSQPVHCPFHEAYYFRYNDLVHGSCESATSYAKPCSTLTRYQLRFNHCANSALYNGRDIDMECLASWKDGSETYFYARLNGPSINSKDEKYRCFKYEHYGSEVTMAMSADATCRGLRSATDGPFLIEFTKDNSGWPGPSCSYPDWLKGVTWRDLSGEFLYSVDEKDFGIIHGNTESGEDGSTDSRHSRRGRNHHSSVAEKYSAQMRCRHSTRISDIEFVIHNFVILNCNSQYQCIRFKKLSERDVVLLYRGNMVDHDSHSHCITEQFESAQLLINSDAQYTSACPRPGIHYTVPVDSCLYRLNIGCSSPSSIDIDHSCSLDQQGLSLQCVASWISDHVTYVIVRPIKHSTDVTCYSFKRDPDGLILFGEDKSCGPEIGQSTGVSVSSSVSSSVSGISSTSSDIRLYRIVRHEHCKTEAKDVLVAHPSAPSVSTAEKQKHSAQQSPSDSIPPSKLPSEPNSPFSHSSDPHHMEPPPIPTDTDLEHLQLQHELLERQQQRKLQQKLRRQQQRLQQQQKWQTNDDAGISSARHGALYSSDNDDEDDNDDYEYSGSAKIVKENIKEDNFDIDVSISYPSDRIRPVMDDTRRTRIENDPWLPLGFDSTTSVSGRLIHTRQSGSSGSASLRSFVVQSFTKLQIIVLCVTYVHRLL